MNKSKFAALLGIAVTSLVVSSAQADDAKILHGTACTASSPSAAVYFTTDSAYTTTSSAFVFCPVIKDNTTTTAGLADLEVSVSNASGSMYCTAFSLDRYGNTLDSSTVYAANGSDKVINFGSAINVSDSRGGYSVFCYLGAGDRLHSIYSLEQ